jgi:aspartate aminotransferase
MYSKRIDALSPSITIAISSLARDLKAEGRDILSFSAGEPDFDTPNRVKEAAIEAVKKGFTRYTAVAGIPELLEAVKTKLDRDNGLKYETNQILVSNGAKQSLFNIMQALLEEGDEVIIPAPYWVTYPELVKYSGATPVIVDCDERNGFKITAKELEDAITPNTKMLIITTPSNPTGAVYSKEELQRLAAVLEGTDITIISDEMYEKLLYDGTEFTSVAAISEDMFNRTITVNGLSKSAAMTGWRMGYLASSNTELVKKMTSLQSQSTSNINSITQVASIPALNGEIDDDIEKMRQAFEARAAEAVKLFNEIDGVSVSKPKGAFYLFVNIKDLGVNSMDFCEKLLEEYGVAVVPGVGFGSEGYFRFSFATDITTIRLGISRIKKFVEKNYKK